MNETELRQSARLIWEAALAAASPATCIRNFIRFHDGVFSAAGNDIDIGGRLVVIGAGKASAKMAQVIEQIFRSRITGGLVVTKYGHALPLQHIQILEAGHPLPDAAGVHAVHETRELLKHLTKDDMILCLISGGGSALWPAPAQGITL